MKYTNINMSTMWNFLLVWNFVKYLLKLTKPYLGISETIVILFSCPQHNFSYFVVEKSVKQANPEKSI